jgi:hypothetical protein
VLGEQQVARLLQQTLKEEKAADKTLTVIAEGSVNDDAAEEFQSQSDEVGPLMRSAEWAGRTGGRAVRQLSRGVRRAASAIGVAQDRSSSRSSSRKSNGRGQQRSTARRRRATTKKR